MYALASRQDLTFDHCYLAVADGRARQLTWVIELTRTNGRWLIERVAATDKQ